MASADSEPLKIAFEVSGTTRRTLNTLRSRDLGAFSRNVLNVSRLELPIHESSPIGYGR